MKNKSNSIMCNDFIRIGISIGIGEYFSKCKYLHSSRFFRKKKWDQWIPTCQPSESHSAFLHQH